MGMYGVGQASRVTVTAGLAEQHRIAFKSQTLARGL